MVMPSRKPLKGPALLPRRAARGYYYPGSSVVAGRDGRDEAALLGKLGLHGRFKFVSEAAKVLIQPAVHFPLGLIGR
jgi:hypothetical protein